MAGRWKQAAGALAATAALALGGAGTAQAWQTPSAAPSNGAVLTITSDGLSRITNPLGLTPLLLSVAASGPASGQQPVFDVPDHHANNFDYQWVFRDRWGGGTVWTISPVGNPSLCLTDWAATIWANPLPNSPMSAPVRPLTLQPCGDGQGQGWIYDGSAHTLRSEWDLYVAYNRLESVAGVLGGSATQAADVQPDGVSPSTDIELFPKQGPSNIQSVTVPAGAGAKVAATFSCPTPYLIFNTDKLHPSVFVKDPIGVTHILSGNAKRFTVTFTRTDNSPSSNATVGFNCMIDTHVL
ncbi:MAG TPA: hypothetical protein VGM91_19295 [Conexibacter sp.]